MSRHKREPHIRQFWTNNEPLIGYYGELYFQLGTFPLSPGTRLDRTHNDSGWSSASIGTELG